MDHPATYYVMPEHYTQLSEDRRELIFEQHLPGVDKKDLNVEVLEGSVCMDFKTRGKDQVARCFPLPYPVDPSSPVGEFKDGIITLRMKLREVITTGKKVVL